MSQIETLLSAQQENDARVTTLQQQRDQLACDHENATLETAGAQVVTRRLEASIQSNLEASQPMEQTPCIPAQLQNTISTSNDSARPEKTVNQSQVTASIIAMGQTSIKTKPCVGCTSSCHDESPIGMTPSTTQPPGTVRKTAVNATAPQPLTKSIATITTKRRTMLHIPKDATQLGLPNPFPSEMQELGNLMPLLIQLQHAARGLEEEQRQIDRCISAAGDREMNNYRQTRDKIDMQIHHVTLQSVQVAALMTAIHQGAPTIDATLSEANRERILFAKHAMMTEPPMKPIAYKQRQPIHDRPVMAIQARPCSTSQTTQAMHIPMETGIPPPPQSTVHALPALAQYPAVGSTAPTTGNYGALLPNPDPLLRERENIHPVYAQSQSTFEPQRQTSYSTHQYIPTFTAPYTLPMTSSPMHPNAGTYGQPWSAHEQMLTTPPLHIQQMAYSQYPMYPNHPVANEWTPVHNNPQTPPQMQIAAVQAQYPTAIVPLHNYPTDPRYRTGPLRPQHNTDQHDMNGHPVRCRHCGANHQSRVCPNPAKPRPHTTGGNNVPLQTTNHGNIPRLFPNPAPPPARPPVVVPLQPAPRRTQRQELVQLYQRLEQLIRDASVIFAHEDEQLHYNHQQVIREQINAIDMEEGYQYGIATAAAGHTAYAYPN
jgi:hypothetical protein